MSTHCLKTLDQRRPSAEAGALSPSDSSDVSPTIDPFLLDTVAPHHMWTFKRFIDSDDSG